MVWDFGAWYDKVKANEGKVTEELYAEAEANLKEGWMRQDEFNRQLNRMAKDHEEKLTEVESIRKRQDDWWAVHKDDVDLLNAYRDRFGDLDEFQDTGDDRMRAPSGDTVSKEQYLKIVQKLTGLETSFKDLQREASDKIANLEAQTNSILSHSSDLQAQHFEEFGKPLNLAKLRTFVQDQNDQGREFASLREAYTEFVAEPREERRKQQMDAERAKMREEVEQEVRSQYGVPAMSQEPERGFFELTKEMRQSLGREEAGQKVQRPTDAEIRAGVLETMRNSSVS